MIDTLVLHRSRPQTTLAPGSAAIWPRDVRWNDFGLNFRIFLEVRSEHQDDVFDCTAFLIPKSGKSSAIESAALNFLMDADGSGRGKKYNLLDHPAPDFHLLLGNAADYSRLASYFNDYFILKSFLLGMQDLVALREWKNQSTTLEMLQRSERFSLGILRDANAYKAFFRGNRFLYAKSAHGHTDALLPFRFDISLEGFTGHPHFLDVEADGQDRFPERAQCLIGANGSGKTRLLSALTNLLRDLAYSANNIQLKSDFISYRGPTFERILAFSFDGSHSYRVDKESEPSNGAEYLPFDLARRPPQDGAFGAPDRTYGTTRLLVDIIRSHDAPEQDWPDHSRLDTLQDALRNFLSMASLYLPLSRDAEFPEVVTDHHGDKWVGVKAIRGLGEQRRLSLLSQVDEARDVTFLSERRVPAQLSSGEQTYLRFALHFLCFIERATLIVIDEPETHLHPNLISGFMLMLREVLEKTCSMALIATHSPFVVREVAREAVHIYKESKSGGIEIFRPMLKTLGASIDEISDAVFGDYSAVKYVDELTNKIISNSETGQAAVERYREKLNPSVLSRIVLKVRSGGFDA